MIEMRRRSIIRAGRNPDRLSAKIAEAGNALRDQVSGKTQSSTFSSSPAWIALIVAVHTLPFKAAFK
jgi:hypothetical protein